MSLTLPPGASGPQLAEWVERHVLPHVSRPARYCGGGWGEEPGTGEGRVLLVFPDVYEIGIGHVGLALIGQALRSEGFLVERAFCPWPDMEALMGQHGVPLYSLESFTPASQFDVVGITVPHELSFTNVLTILNLAGIPLLQRERSPHHPYVLGGGSGLANPEPVAEFFDLFILGEAEEVIAPVARALVEGRRSGSARDQVLARVAHLPGVYVPSLYRLDEDCGRVVPSHPWVPERREAARAKGFFPYALPLPLVEATHDRFPIEVMRGCPRRCAFCQARVYYGPPRLRPFSQVVSMALEAARAGWGEVSLLSLSTGDLPHLGELVASLYQSLPPGVGISLPSLRAETFDDALCLQLKRGHHRGLTLAPEAGTERLRASIGKELSDEQLLEAVRRAFAHGWTNVKLYFMVGLPQETEADVEAIGTLVRRVWAEARRGRQRVAVSCAPFVPKPHTPLEREPFLEPSELERRMRVVKAMVPRGVEYSWRDPLMSLWETVCARADRRFCGVILRAWTLGARFDEWEGTFRHEVWARAASECGVDVQALRGPLTGPLPWAHLAFPRGARGQAHRERPVAVACQEPSTAGAVRVRMAFAKLGLRRFLSHLETARVWQVVLRRANADLVYTEGFSPRPKISLGPALPVGVASLAEYLDFWTRRHDLDSLGHDVRAHCPEGMTLRTLVQIPPHAPSLDSVISVADYLVATPSPHELLERVQGKALAVELRPEGLWVRVALRDQHALGLRDLVRAGCLVTREALWVARGQALVSPLEAW